MCPNHYKNTKTKKPNSLQLEVLLKNFKTLKRKNVQLVALKLNIQERLKRSLKTTIQTPLRITTQTLNLKRRRFRK